MSLNSQDPAAIHYRFTRALLTDYQEVSNQYFVKASDLVPMVELETGDILTAYEVFLFAELLVNIREIRELKTRLALLEARSA